MQVNMMSEIFSDVYLIENAKIRNNDKNKMYVK